MSSPRTDNRTKVLVLIKGLGIGGAEVLISEGARHWDLDRFDYSVAYVLPWKDQLVEPITDLGIEVTCVGGEKGLTPATFARFRTLVKETAPDLIHAHLPSSGILARVAGGVPVVYTEHNIASSYREPTKTLNKATYGRNRAVIAVSEPVAESLSGYPGPEPVVIPNGVAPMREPGGEARAELGIAETTKLIVHVGNIRPHKGHTNLIQATALMHNDDFLVVSIGGEKHEGDLVRVIGEAEEAGVGSRIRFLGRRPDARTFIDAADVIVNPADVEGLPVSILEALASAKPVVATAVGGVPSVVRHEVSGLLVPPSDPQALAAGLDRSLTDPDAAEWGSNGARHVFEHHSISRMIRRYETIYREALNG